jgi:PKD repeat protein
MDPNTVDKVKFHVGDVGAAAWEEISVGGTDYPLANYGWPVMEGPCDIGSNTDCPTRSEFQDPIYYYEHTKNTEGGAVTGSVFVPDGLWPSEYKFLFVDFIFGRIYNLIEDDSRECRDCVPPVPAYRNETFHELEDMVDMFFGPYNGGQALYIVSRTDGQNIRRIRYTDSNNRSPVANFTVDDTSAMIGEVLSFDGSASSDPDGDGLTYMWDFGDGSASASQTPQYSYTRNGAFTVTLTVEDTGGLSAQTYILVSVGTPPKAEMLSPAEGATFAVGEHLLLSGYGMDSIGNELNNSQIFWEVRQHHASHFHPFLDKSAGNDIDLFAAPGPEDFMAATNSFLRIIMYAVDSYGVTTEISRDVLPKLVYIDIDSIPQQMNLLVDEFPVETPGTITSWQNHKLHLDVDDQYPFTFASWSDGGLRSHTMTVPEASSNNPYVAVTFQANASAYEPIDFVWTLKNCSSSELCGRCEGHCQSDAECVGSLICFLKGGRNLSVPGCLGLDPSNTDWCTTDSGFNLSSTIGTSVAPTPSPIVVAPVGIPYPGDYAPVVPPTAKPAADATDEPIVLVRGKPSTNGTSGGVSNGFFSISCVVGIAAVAFVHLA